MSHAELSRSDLVSLVQRVFRPRPQDRALAILVDLPDADCPDRLAWRWRRELCASWRDALSASRAETGLDVALFAFRNVRRANADLPALACRCDTGELPPDADAPAAAPTEPVERILATHSIVLAPTEMSATAPLKLAARRLGFRAATMPGFTEAMLPALRLDLAAVARRVQLLAGLLERAGSAGVDLVTAAGRRCLLQLDLRHRSAHASTGLLPEPGTVGNLPSGEAYIVPYEGERPADPSRSAGELPVELDGEVVVYRIERNRAVSVEPGGPVAAREAELLAAEPAYGNLAELGLGVLAGFGVVPTGEVLLDEKLGVHIAFGRSDHFGGQVGAAQFSRPEAVVHIDRVYVPAIQPQLRLARAYLTLDDAGLVELVRDDRWVVDFAGR